MGVKGALAPCGGGTGLGGLPPNPLADLSTGYKLDKRFFPTRSTKSFHCILSIFDPQIRHEAGRGIDTRTYHLTSPSEHPQATPPRTAIPSMRDPRLGGTGLGVKGALAPCGGGTGLGGLPPDSLADLSTGYKLDKRFFPTRSTKSFHCILSIFDPQIRHEAGRAELIHGRIT
ncbi:hypothetical protein EDC14_102926 [Hydrogenispora ethanolica]|uniref:Uncharacterized protein n=1 Tax=Hydrogenispora ethanolica TaxID=1082276 RepID=A0A4V2QCW5_HYDET|nr:hypothetical protein EDC14_102926 [Hydrogenispora ethanolica]